MEALGAIPMLQESSARGLISASKALEDMRGVGFKMDSVQTMQRHVKVAATLSTWCPHVCFPSLGLRT